jgi:16S rRNA (guanine1207-N2)-methyltransferase
LSEPTKPVGYHQFRIHEARIADQDYRYVTKPGIVNWNRVDDDVELLLTGSDLAAGQRVAVVGCGHGLLGAAIGDQVPGVQLTLLDSNLVAVRAAEKTMQLYDFAGTRVVLSDGLGGVAGEPFDRVLIDLPKGKALVRQILCQALDVLVPGGRVYLAGGNREGIKSYAALLGDIFGNVSLSKFGGGHRVVTGVKEVGAPSLLAGHAEYRYQDVTVHDQVYRMASKPGVFSWERLDDGTRMLLGCLEVSEADQILDLGCGSGIVGAVAASMAPTGHAYLVDSDITAVNAARATIKANSLPNATVLTSDIASDIHHLTFDRVATNLPFHVGVGSDHSVALQFIADAHEVLRDNGVLYLVANLFLKYEPYVTKVFGNCETVAKDTRYKVLRATKQPKHRISGPRRHPQDRDAISNARTGKRRGQGLADGRPLQRVQLPEGGGASASVLADG